MNFPQEVRLSLTVLCLVGLSSSGCATFNHTQNGALLGAGLGAGAGAILGHQSGDAGAGAVLGGALGAFGGALAGNAEDAWEQRDAALRQLAATSRPLPPPLTNSDLIRMSQAGLSDEVIMNAVQTRGGQFQLHPEGLITLKSSGVSEGVIQYVQSRSSAVASQTFVAPPPEVVIVHPEPLIDVHVGPPPMPCGPVHHFRRPRRGLSFHAHHDF